MAKRIITCAVTGSGHTPSMSPYLPITTDQISQAALDAADAGAAIVHLHARNPENGQPTSDVGIFKEIVDKIRLKNKDVIIGITTGGAPTMTNAERLAVVPELNPEICSMNSGTLNWAVIASQELIDSCKYQWEKDLAQMMGLKGIFKNTFEDIKYALETMNKYGTKPELEIYDLGQIYNLKLMKDFGLISGRPMLQFVMGVTGGIAATTKNLLLLKETADEVFGLGQYEWSAFGTGKTEYSICTQNLLLGGHCRVGMEDNLYLSKGVPATNNGDMVAKMARIMKELDIEIASPDEAREILRLKK